MSADFEVAQSLKNLVDSGFSWGWTRAFSAVGKIAPRRPIRWTTTGTARVVVVAPHPDDEVLGCGGTILRHVAAGDEVVVVVATNGRLSRALKLSPTDTARARRAEASRASELLGVPTSRHVWLGLPEGTWSDDELVTPLAQSVADADIVYSPSRYDFHPEHRRVAAAVARALDALPVAERPVVRMYPAQVPLTADLINLICDVTAVSAELTAAFAAYSSQANTLRPWRRMRAYAAARYQVGELLEVFAEVDASEFVALHAGDQPAGVGRFRGVRYRSWFDPLAWLATHRNQRRQQAR